MIKKCEICGKEFETPKTYRRYCCDGDVKVDSRKTIPQKVSIGLLALILTVLVAHGAIRDVGSRPEPVGASRIVEAEFVPTGEGVQKVDVEAEAEVEPEVAEEPVVEEIVTDPAVYIAKTVYGEARGLGATEQAAVVWCILNRVDAYGSDIVSVVTAPSQFHGYSAWNPVTDEIYSLVADVLQRWENEKAGMENVGRVLPKEYLYFYGSGGRNYFTTEWRGGTTWDWTMTSPYGNGY